MTLIHLNPISEGEAVKWLQVYIRSPAPMRNTFCPHCKCVTAHSCPGLRASASRSASRRGRPTSKRPYLAQLSQTGGRTSERWRRVWCFPARYLPVITCSAESSPRLVPTRGPGPGAAIQERDKPWKKHILQKNITYTESKTATENAVGGASTWRYKKENARNVISWINAEFPLHKVTLSNSSFLLSNSNQFEKRQSTDQFHLVKHRHEVQRQLLLFHLTVTTQNRVDPALFSFPANVLTQCAKVHP